MPLPFVQLRAIECSHKVNVHNVCKSSHFRRTVCFPSLSVLLFSLILFFYVCVHFAVSLPLCCHDICVNAMPGSCFPFCVAGWSSRKMLSSWSAQGTLWPEDHGQVFVSEVRNIWSIAPGICIFMLWLLYLLQIPQCTPYLTLFILYVFQVWNRNRANIWNTRPLWHQGKEKGFISFCSIWLVLIWHNESSFNEFHSVKPLT